MILQTNGISLCYSDSVIWVTGGVFSVSTVLKLTMIASEIDLHYKVILMFTCHIFHILR